MKITLENPPEGFAKDLRIGFPKKGDYILLPGGTPEQITGAVPGFPCIILTPLPKPPKNGDKFTDEHEHGREWEVGACYFADTGLVLIEVLSVGKFAKHSSISGRSFTGRRFPCIDNWRKVIEPDGTPCDCETLDETSARLGKDNRVERCEVDPRDGWLWITAPNGGNYTITDCMNSADFRGCVYRHPNGREKVFGFCHPIMVHKAAETADWDFTHSVGRNPMYSTMLRPVAVLMEVEA